MSSLLPWTWSVVVLESGEAPSVREDRGDRRRIGTYMHWHLENTFTIRLA